MIESIRIRNFKSIKELKLNCKRINIFIGEPNTGKSNILEALGLLSFLYHRTYNGPNDFVRLERTSNLFYNENVQDKIEINIKTNSEIIDLNMGLEEGRFRGEVNKGEIDSERKEKVVRFEGDFETIRVRGSSGYIPVKFYRFKVERNFPFLESQFVLPSSGRNLLSVILSNKELTHMIERLLKPFGLRLVLKPQEKTIQVMKLLGNVMVSYPYSLISDTLQRLIFYLSVITTNKNSTLVFEEPESKAFPYYTKYMAEKIALDRNGNQYFISTHNPYFLLPLVEKVDIKDINVIITYFRGHKTHIKNLVKKKIELMVGMNADVFFGLERLMGKK